MPRKWYNCWGLCWCCSIEKDNSEVVLLTKTQSPVSLQSYTVRRISSFGQTYVNDLGEEEEVCRHASIPPSYAVGQQLSCFSVPLPVQPGVISSRKGEDGRKWKGQGCEGYKHKRKWDRVFDYKTRRNDQSAIYSQDHRIERVLEDAKNSDEEESSAPTSSTIAENVQHQPVYSSSPNLTNGVKSPPQHCMTTAKADKESMESRRNKRNNWLKSQSLMDVTMRSEEENRLNDKQVACHPLSESSETSMDVDRVALAKQFGLDLSLYVEPDEYVADVGDHACVELPPRVVIKVESSPEKRSIGVTVVKLEGLGGGGFDNSDYTVLVKLTMVEAGQKRATFSTRQVHFRGRIDQTFDFVKPDQPSFLRLSVFDTSYQGSNDALGYALLPVDSVGQDQSSHSLPVLFRTSPMESVGTVRLTFSYSMGQFTVTLHRLLHCSPDIGKEKLFFKMSYHSSSKKIKEKTSTTFTMEEESTPLEMELVLKCDPRSGSHCFLLVTLKKELSKAIFRNVRSLGRVRLGPLLYSPAGLTLWGEALLQSRSVTNSYHLFL